MIVRLDNGRPSGTADRKHQNQLLLSDQFSVISGNASSSEIKAYPAMSSAELVERDKEEEPKEGVGADSVPGEEQTSIDSETLAAHDPSPAAASTTDVPADPDQPISNELDEEQREEEREGLERQRRENTQEDQDQRSEDPDLVQEEMVSGFQEGKKRVKVSKSTV